MKRKRQIIAGLLVLLCGCFLLIVAAGGRSHVSTSNSVSQLKWREGTPGAMGTPSSTTGGTSTTNANVTGEFVGMLSNTATPAWIALSAKDNRLVALTSDSTPRHNATFVQWFKGVILNNNVVASPVDVPNKINVAATPGATPGVTPDVTPGVTPDVTPGITPGSSPEATPTIIMPGGVVTVTPGGNKGSNLMAVLTPSEVSGTIILEDGQSFPFNAHAVSGTTLYRSEQTIRGTKYVAGWIVTPTTATGPSATATPVASATSATGDDVTPEVTPTATTVVSMPSSVGVIVNQQTGQTTQAPALTPQNIALKQVSVPDLGTFKLQACKIGRC